MISDFDGGGGGPAGSHPRPPDDDKQSLPHTGHLCNSMPKKLTEEDELELTLTTEDGISIHIQADKPVPEATKNALTELALKALQTFKLGMVSLNGKGKVTAAMNRRITDYLQRPGRWN